MLQVMRQSVLVDSGQTVNTLGAMLIETPDAYKKLNPFGVIVSVGPKCRLVSMADVGRRVLLGLVRNEEDRIRPAEAKRLGLKPHWHYIAHESKIDMIVE